MAHRSTFACVDGQMATVIKTCRDWKISGDTDWLRENWDTVKRILSYAWDERNEHEWDRDRDGVLEGRQHHTLDMELFGPNTWLNTFYLAALAAAAAMDRPFLGMDTSSCAVMISRRRLSEAALTVDMEFGCEGAELEADVASGIGFDEITLTRYDPGRKDRKGIEGLDCVDSWSVGFLKDGIFHTQNLSMRQKHQPAIAPSLLLPQLHGVPAISVTDVWGRSSVWIEK